MNADIAAKIRLYLNYYCIIKIKIHNGRYLCLFVVNNEIEIIPICFLSAHVSNMGWEWYVRAVASVVRDCCRWLPWLLKYNYIVHRKERKADTILSLRSSRALR